MLTNNKLLPRSETITELKVALQLTLDHLPRKAVSRSFRYEIQNTTEQIHIWIIDVQVMRACKCDIPRLNCQREGEARVLTFKPRNIICESHMNKTASPVLFH